MKFSFQVKYGFQMKKKRTIRFFLIYPVYAVPLDTD